MLYNYVFWRVDVGSNSIVPFSKKWENRGPAGLSEELITVISVFTSVLGFDVAGTKANPGVENVVTHVIPTSTTFHGKVGDNH